MSVKRSRKAIRVWLIENDYTVSHISRTSGVDLSIVSRAMNGENNNRRVLRALVAVGCPADLLALPTDMQPQKAA